MAGTRPRPRGAVGYRSLSGTRGRLSRSAPTSQSNVVWYGLMDFTPKLDHQAESPLYRQLFEQIAQQIRSGQLARGERLPATRELAGLLGLNRTTVSAAYEMLETEGLISGQVGRGSFVTGSF